MGELFYMFEELHVDDNNSDDINNVYIFQKMGQSKRSENERINGRTSELLDQIMGGG